MTRLKTHYFSAGLIGAGAVVCAMTARPLHSHEDTGIPLNVLGINRSPYGEVFAMAMQGPIDVHFHQTLDGRTNHRPDTEESDRCHEPCDHGDGSACEPDDPARAPRGFRNNLAGFIERLDGASTARTNSKPLGEAHRFQIRRRIEDKLRFAYRLDPAHYGNYNSLHFFITEPQLGTRPELTPAAAKLAHETITYCLAQDDPRAALTAAAAAENVIELMFNDTRSDNPRYNLTQMRQTLGLIDHCLARFDTLSARWDATGHWDLLSPMRLGEVRSRHAFVLKIRDAAEQTIQRLTEETSLRNQEVSVR